MSQSAGSVGSDGSDFTGSFIVVPPNGSRYSDPDVIRRVESFLRKRFPFHDVEVARVVQPRIETFTVIERNAGNGEGSGDQMRGQIIDALAGFDPDAPELKLD